MADLKTRYMGIELNSPIIVGACSLSKKVETIKEIEAAGAGALVIKTLFQEQIELERSVFEDALRQGENCYSESLDFFPKLQYHGVEEHIMWVEEARDAVKMPLIASLGARGMGQWTEYAKRLAGAGVRGLEINCYSVEADPEGKSADAEERLVKIVGAVKAAVDVPVAVKLSPFYTCMANLCKRLAGEGADALVMFNRFFQPDIDVEKESLKLSMDYSSPADTRLPLRWIAILSGQVGCDLAATTGVHSPEDVVKHLLAGAAATQVVSALYVNSVDYIGRLNEGLAAWMDAKGYRSIDDFRGKVSQEKLNDPYGFERAQYIKLLLGVD